MSDMIDNADESRFELHVDSHVAYADYRRQGNDLYIDYVFAPVPLRGTGASGRLMAGIQQLAVAQGLKIIPICGYAATWLRRHAPKT